MAYLHDLRDTPQEPPDDRLLARAVANRLALKLNEVKEDLEALQRRGYVQYVIVERQRHYRLTPRGTRAHERHIEEAGDY